MPDVTVERVDTIALRIPYDHWAPKPTFGGIVRETMDCLLVRVTASNGFVGWGESFWGGWQATQAAVEHWIAPLVVAASDNVLDDESRMKPRHRQLLFLIQSLHRRLDYREITWQSGTGTDASRRCCTCRGAACACAPDAGRQHPELCAGDDTDAAGSQPE